MSGKGLATHPLPCAAPGWAASRSAAFPLSLRRSVGVGAGGLRRGEAPMTWWGKEGRPVAPPRGGRKSGGAASQK